MQGHVVHRYTALVDKYFHLFLPHCFFFFDASLTIDLEPYATV